MGAGILTGAAAFARATALPFLVPVGLYVVVMAWHRHDRGRAAMAVTAFGGAAIGMLVLLDLAT